MVEEATCTVEDEGAVEHDLKCPVCLGVLTDPVMHAPCGNMLCRACAAPLRACPLCRAEPLALSAVPRFVLNKLAAVAVRCDRCGQTFPRGDFASAHAARCTLPCPRGCGAAVCAATADAHAAACPRAAAACPARALGCPWSGARPDAAAHAAACPIAQLQPLLLRLVARVDALEARLASSSSSASPPSAAVAAVAAASASRAHRGRFGVGGAGCPGSCCPVCKRTGDKCPRGGRWTCCGLCEDCSARFGGCNQQP